MYLPFPDHLLNEMREKLVEPLPGFQAQFLIPGKLERLNDATVDAIYAHYGDDMNITKAEFENEVARWKER